MLIADEQNFSVKHYLNTVGLYCVKATFFFLLEILFRPFLAFHI